MCLNCKSDYVRYVNQNAHMDKQHSKNTLLFAPFVNSRLQKHCVSKHVVRYRYIHVHHGDVALSN